MSSAENFENDHPTTNAHDPLTPWACQVASEGPAILDMAVDFHGLCRACVIVAGSVALNVPGIEGQPSETCSARTHAAFYGEYAARHGLVV